MSATKADMPPASHGDSGSPGDAGSRSRTMRTRPRLTDTTAFWVGLVLVALILLFTVLSEDQRFLQLENFRSMTLNAAVLVVVSAGMTYVLSAGELDLSIGANLILASVFASKAMAAVGGSPEQVATGEYAHLGIAIVVGTAVAVASGAVFGLVNGLLVTRAKLSSFIVTLATTGIGTGLAYVITGGYDIHELPNALQTDFGNKAVAGVFPLPAIVTAVVFVVLWYVMRATIFGQRTVAVGSSREAAERAGIATGRHVVYLFMLMGVLAGIGAMIDVSRFLTTNISGHQTDALSAISAVVIGGTSLFGGRAAMGGTLMGALIPIVLGAGLVILNVPAFYQLIVVGVVLLAAVMVDQRRRAHAT